jgi:hypothetical protein
MKPVHSATLIALTVLTLLSLALNVIVISGLLQVRETAHGIVADARTVVDDLAADTFTYSVEIDQEFPVNMEFPFSQTMTIPINTVVPINTRVVVPVDLGITTYNIRVPINTVFPVDMEFTVPVSQVVDIDTVVPMSLTVPVEIAVPETPLAGYLIDVEEALGRTEERLEQPLWEWRRMIDAR